MPRFGGWRVHLESPHGRCYHVSVSLPRFGGWRASRNRFLNYDRIVSVSLPRFGGWRECSGDPPLTVLKGFSLVAEIWGLASNAAAILRLLSLKRFSLVAEIWGLARNKAGTEPERVWKFQSRCRDLGVGECSRAISPPPLRVVSVSLPRFGGWRVPDHHFLLSVAPVSVSLPRFGGWRALSSLGQGRTHRRFSLVAEIWGLASIGNR